MLGVIKFLRCFCRARCEEDSEESGTFRLVEQYYEIGEVIGRGRLGVVHKCIRRSTREQFACKMMPNTNDAYKEMLLFGNQLSGNHRGILEVKDCYWPQWKGGKISDNLYMISELCDGGDVGRLVRRNGILSEKEAATIMECIVEALRYCHSQRIIHRDIKPSSIFISKSGSSWVAKLGNFDRSIHLEAGVGRLPRVKVGTLGYSAPEILIGNGYSYEVDIWSAGVVLYYLLCGRTPFQLANEYAMRVTLFEVGEEAVMRRYKQIQKKSVDVGSGVWSSISDSAKEVVLGMLEKNVERRLSCNEILSHPWIVGNAEMEVRSSFTFDTQIGATSSSICRDADHPWIVGNAEMEVASSSTINTEIVATAGVDNEVASNSTFNTEIVATARVDDEVASISTTVKTEVVATSGVDNEVASSSAVNTEIVATSAAEDEVGSTSTVNTQIVATLGVDDGDQD